MVLKSKSKEFPLDLEWVELIKKAIMLGLTPEEVRSFLEKNRKGA